jgi:diguanylate cyclase (GGDEF)-like protein/putative nucleotidyltransferase with HDIG domain
MWGRSMKGPWSGRVLRWSALRDAAVERIGEGDVRWRSLGGLFGAGGALALISLLLPAEASAQQWAVAILGLTAMLSAAIMIFAAERLPSADLLVSVTLGFGTLLVSGAVYYTHAAASPFVLLYVWVSFDGYFFLSRRAASRHLVFAGACYALVLIALPEHGSAAAAHWLLLMGTLAVVGTLADILRERSDRLIGQLGDAAVTDALTGLLNRRGFEKLIEEELERARRGDSSVSLLLGDLDHFKAINDEFGHHEGDLALRAFSDLFVATKRRIDGAARIGGEEFALILPATDEHGAYQMAERLRRRVRELPRERGRPLSISIGVVAYPRHGATAGELLHSADQALYVAKRLGRDRSVLYSPEVAASLRSRPELERTTVEQLPAVLVLAETLDLRDAGTSTHSQTVGGYAEAIARQLGLDPAHVERIRLAGLLHDIGKIGVPDEVLRKAGPLDDGEWLEIRKHPDLGARILAGANLDDISGWVLAHHERPDGTGYPAELPAEEIPLEARILSVADAYEAMTSDRVYRPSLAVLDAIAQLTANSGTQFDAQVVEAFLAVLDTLSPFAAQPDP